MALYSSTFSSLSFMASNRTLTCLNSTTGETILTYPSMPANITNLTCNASENCVITSDALGNVRCIATKTASVYWQKKYEGDIVSIIATDLLVYICNNKGIIWCLWLHDGTKVFDTKNQLMKIKNGSGHPRPPPFGKCVDMAATPYGVILCFASPALICHDQTTGRVAWSLNIDEESKDVTTCFSAWVDSFSTGSRSGAIAHYHIISDDECNLVWTYSHSSSSSRSIGNADTARLMTTALTQTSTHILAGSPTGLSCHSASDGALIWTVLTHGYLSTLSLMSPEEVVTGCDSRSIQMWNVNTGAMISEKHCEQSIKQVHCDVDSKSVLYRDGSNGVTCLEEGFGVSWRFEPYTYVICLSLDRRSNYLCAGNSDGSIKVYDSRNKIVWESVGGGTKRGIDRLCIDDRRVYGGNSTGVSCYEFLGAGGKADDKIFSEALWTYSVPYSLSAMYLDDDEKTTIFLGYKYGHVTCLDRKTGGVVWNVCVESGEGSSEGIWEVVKIVSGDDDDDIAGNAEVIIVGLININCGSSKLVNVSMKDGTVNSSVNVSGIITDVMGINENSSVKKGSDNAKKTRPSEVGSFIESQKGLGSFMKGKDRSIINKSVVFLMADGVGLYDRVNERVSHTIKMISKQKKRKDGVVITCGTLVGDAIVVCLDGCVAVLRTFTLDFATKLKVVWRSSRISEYVLTNIVTHKNCTILSAGPEMYIVNYSPKSEPSVNEMNPSWHDDWISCLIWRRGWVLSGGVEIVRHNCSMARRYDGMPVGGVVGGDGNETEDPDYGDGLLRRTFSKTVGYAMRLSKYIETHEFYIDFRVMQLTNLLIFMQRVSFGFKKVDAPWTYDDVANFLESIGEIDVLPEMAGMYLIYFMASIATVSIFLLTFVIQERIEILKFLNPSVQLYQNIWSVFTNLSSAATGVLCIPICGHLVSIFNCISFQGDQVIGSSLSEDYWQTISDGGVPSVDLIAAQNPTQCYTNTHYVYMIITCVLAPMYIVLSVRFIRVDKNLDSIEAVSMHPFDWKADTISKEPRHHVLSIIDTTSENASFIVSLLLSLISVFVVSEKVTVLSNAIVQACLCITLHLYPPHFDKESNGVAMLLSWSTLYVFSYAVLTSLLEDNENHVVLWVAPAGTPVFLFGGFMWIKRDLIRSWFMEKVLGQTVTEKEWARGEGLIAKKVLGEKDDEEGQKPWVSWWNNIRQSGLCRLCCKSNTAKVYLTAEGDDDKKQNRDDVVALQTTEVDDSDDFMDDDEDSIKLKSEDKKSQKELSKFGSKVAYHTAFVSLIVSMAMIYFTGSQFFFSVNFDLHNDYVRHSSLGIVAAFSGVVVNTMNLVVASEDRTAPFMVVLLGVGLNAVAVDYGLVTTLNLAGSCLTMPIMYDVVAHGDDNDGGEGEESGNVRWSYPNSEAGIDSTWWESSDERVFDLACPIMLPGRTGLAHCQCCGSRDNVDGYLRLRVIVYNDNAGGINEDTGSIGNCACFEAENVGCEDVGDFKRIVKISLALEAALVFLTSVSLLFSIDRVLSSTTSFFEARRKTTWDTWKAEQIKSVEKVLAKARERERAAVVTSLRSPTASDSSGGGGRG
jgi:outer membrane protein assembly factor BamB